MNYIVLHSTIYGSSEKVALLIMFERFFPPMPLAPLLAWKSQRLWKNLYQLPMTFIFFKDQSYSCHPFIKSVFHFSILSFNLIVISTKRREIQILHGKLQKLMVLRIFKSIISFWFNQTVVTLDLLSQSGIVSFLST